MSTASSAMIDHMLEARARSKRRLEHVAPLLQQMRTAFKDEQSLATRAGGEESILRKDLLAQRDGFAVAHHHHPHHSHSSPRDQKGQQQTPSARGQGSSSIGKLPAISPRKTDASSTSSPRVNARGNPQRSGSIAAFGVPSNQGSLAARGIIDPFEEEARLLRDLGAERHHLSTGGEGASALSVQLAKGDGSSLPFHNGKAPQMVSGGVKSQSKVVSKSDLLHDHPIGSGIGVDGQGDGDSTAAGRPTRYGVSEALHRRAGPIPNVSKETVFGAIDIVDAAYCGNINRFGLLGNPSIPVAYEREGGSDSIRYKGPNARGRFVVNQNVLTGGAVGPAMPEMKTGPVSVDEALNDMSHLTVTRTGRCAMVQTPTAQMEPTPPSGPQREKKKTELCVKVGEKLTPMRTQPTALNGSVPRNAVSGLAVPAVSSADPNAGFSAPQTSRVPQPPPALGPGGSTQKDGKALTPRGKAPATHHYHHHHGPSHGHKHATMSGALGGSGAQQQQHKHQGPRLSNTGASFTATPRKGAAGPSGSMWGPSPPKVGGNGAKMNDGTAPPSARGPGENLRIALAGCDKAYAQLKATVESVERHVAYLHQAEQAGRAPQDRQAAQAIGSVKALDEHRQQLDKAVERAAGLVARAAAGYRTG